MNICNIPKDAKIVFGSGGSHNIIIITKNKRVFKYFPIIYSETDTKKSVNEKIKFVKIEINNMKKILKLNLPHIIKLIGIYICNKISESFFTRCENFISFIKSENKCYKECTYLYDNYPYLIYPKMYVCELEYCDFTIEEYINYLCKYNINDIIIPLNIILYQLCFTLLQITKIYPYFIHKDLHLGNVMCKISCDKNKNKYIMDSTECYLPSWLKIKITDFQFSLFEKSDYSYSNLKYKKYPLFDIFTFLLNLIYEFNKCKKKIKKIYDFINKFINVNIILKLIKNNKYPLLYKNRIAIYEKHFSSLFNVKSEIEIIKIISKDFNNI
jgi:hypothetical protein